MSSLAERTAPTERTIRLSPYQRMVFQHPSRFKVLIAGRRFGKTFLANVELFSHAVNNTGSTCWYVYPTYRQAKEVAWRDLKALIPREYVMGRPNESDLSIVLLNGSRIALKGADNYDSLRGPGLDLLVMDEFALIDTLAWSEVLRPMLSDKLGRGLFITTPQGLNWAYDLYLRGQNGNPQWQSWQYTTLEGGNVAADEIAEARATLDLRTFRQEYEASFETLTGRVYSNFDRNANVQPCADTGSDILVGMDFNVNPMSAVIAVRAVDQCHVIAALEIQTSNTEEMAAELKARYPGRSVIVCPDPSGTARKTSAPVGQTDFTILKAHGFTVRSPAKAPPVVDRINNTQAMLCNANGDRRLYVDPNCERLIRALDGLTYKDGTSQPNKTLGLDHVTDALGYLLWQEFNVLTFRGKVTTFRS